MTRFTKLDLSQLAPPALIETIDYESILAAQKAWVTALWDAYRVTRPDLPALDTLMLETEPITVILEGVAYRETLLRALVNDKARAVLLAYAVGSDLDQVGALFDTPRREIAPGVFQSDAEYREELQLAPEAFSTAGPEGAYIYFARRAHPSLSDAAALHPHTNRIDVVVLARDGSGAASTEAVTAAYSALSPKSTRPLTDDVHVRSADIVETTIKVVLQIPSGPASEAIRAGALKALEAYRVARRRIGLAIRLDGIIAAARFGGDIEKTIVINPTADVDPGSYGAVHVAGIEVEIEVLP